MQARRRVPRRGRRADGRRDRHGRGVRGRRQGQDLRHLQGQGLPGHDQAPQLLPRPQVATARTTCAPRARSAPPPTPAARVEGHPRPRPDGQQARHPEGPRGRARRRRARTCCWSAAPSPARATASWRCAPMARRSRPRRRRRRSSSTTPRSARASTARSSTSRCAPSSTRAAQGTHATKTRGNVRGGGAKPWRQKGTGRARAGSIRSPNWTGGGIVFGPSPRHYTFKVNRKERRAALRSALSRARRARHDRGPRPRGLRRALDPKRPPGCSATGPAARLGARRARPRSRRASRCRSATSPRVSVLPATGRRRRRPHRRRRACSSPRRRSTPAHRARQGRADRRRHRTRRGGA